MRGGPPLTDEHQVLHLVGPTVFAWDREKARINREKHGVSFEEAATVFGDHGAMILAVPDHSDDEDRFVLIGYSIGRRLLTVVHVERRQILRIISAWSADRAERKLYEEER